jgi:hypothetical protein
VNAWHVCGVLFATWAVVVSLLGITHENFPGSEGRFRAVAAISVLLAIAAIGSAIYTGATEEDEDEGDSAAVFFMQV